MVARSDTYFVYNTPLGRITLASNGQGITHMLFGPVDLPGQKRATALTNTASTQILEYLAGKRREFDVPLALQGTDFQMKVWKALLDIPYGQTRTYQDIACAIGSPNASRAVGSANNKNPLAILVPCHRVIGKNGNLVGYAAGLHIKKYLLDLEARTCAQ